MKIKGKYNEAQIFVNNPHDIDFASINQVKALCDFKILEDSKIRIMPDICPGIGTTIGSTFTYEEKIIPSLVSGDIGCGVTCVRFKDKNIELSKIDKIIREQLLERKKIDSILSKYQEKVNLNHLYCKKYVDIDRCYNKLGELGGGNHFFSLSKDEYGYLYLTIHSGSRLLGQQVYDFYINEGYKEINDKSYNRLYTYLKDNLMEMYLHDIEIATSFASANREVIIEIISKFTKNKIIERYESIHNYVDAKNKIIRKGAISSLKDEDLVIPISASPIYGGIILGKGLGNEEWNYSAPHGAGRICSRSEAKDLFSFSEYKKAMEGVHSMSITKESIDESPMVYRTKDYLLENIKDSVQVEKILKPIYNYQTREK